MKKKYFKTLTIFLLTFIFSSENLKAVDYFLQSSGGAISNLTAWNSALNGSGSAPTSFAGINDIWHITNRPGGTNFNFGTFPIPSSATLIIENGNNLTVSTSAVFSNAFSIDIAAGGILTISKATNFNLNNLDPASTVIYNTSAFAVIPKTYGNLTIAVTQSIVGSGADLFVQGMLTINSSQTFSLNGNYLHLNGFNTQISGAGGILGDASAIIELTNGNSGNNGTLNFAVGGQKLLFLIVNYSSALNTIVLGSDLTIENGLFDQTFGSIDLNGNSLTIDVGSDANFPLSGNDGDIIGNSNSSLIILGTLGQFGSTGTSLFMNSSNNTLKVLAFNHVGYNLVIGNTLNITDSLSVQAGALTTGGNITLKSTAALKGRLGKLGVGASISGNLNIETFVPGATTGWANWGAGGLSGLTVSNWESQIPMTCNTCPNLTTSIPGGFASIQGWNEASSLYEDAINVTDNLTTGKGFWVYVGSGFSSTSDYTLLNTGAPVVGTQNIALTATGSGTNLGYNLVSNPYASPISWAKVLAASSNVANSIYAFNADLGGGSGAYTQHVGGVSTPGGSTGITDVIPAGQGFYVIASAATNLVFTEDAKVASNTSANPLLKQTASPSIGKFFRLKLEGQYDNDETVFRFHQDASSSFDLNWDAHKIFQSPGYAGYPGSYTKYTTISSKDSFNDDYSIHSVPPLTTSLSIPVLARVSTTGTYTINAFDFQDFEMCVSLKDKLDNSTHDLRTSSYVFTISDTTSAPRFELILCKDESLSTVGLASNANTTSSILISQDANSAFVKTRFEKNTKATISVYNIIGQKLMEDIQVEGTVTNTALPIDLHNQVVLIKVSTDKESVTKKVVMH